MAEERDPKISRRYRELGDEEPPRELDQAILAAAHRAADRAHAPLVAPAGRHRWYFALGAAAILVLAVAITVQVERQQLDPEGLRRGFGPRCIGAQGGLFERTGARRSGDAQGRVAPISQSPQPAEQRRKAAGGRGSARLTDSRCSHRARFKGTANSPGVYPVLASRPQLHRSRPGQPPRRRRQARSQRRTGGSE